MGKHNSSNLAAPSNFCNVGSGLIIFTYMFEDDLLSHTLYKKISSGRMSEISLTFKVSKHRRQKHQLLERDIRPGKRSQNYIPSKHSCWPKQKHMEYCQDLLEMGK